MKKLILSLAILSSIAMTAQQKHFAISIVQDARLAIKGDNIGNDPFTTNFIANIEIRANDNGTGYGLLIPTLEYANLKGGEYYRYGVNGGYTFTGITFADVTPFAGVGAISRQTTGESGENTFWPSFALGLDISIHLLKNVDLVILNQLTDRKDLKMIWNSKQYFNYSFYVGAKYNF